MVGKLVVLLQRLFENITLRGSEMQLKLIVNQRSKILR